ncbi:transmembrane protein [Rhynchospora pubera]|uniref:Transmembrane protein n=1 Tax=Rhynchospora pubera TaxID=906938 RepID=A0AAV8C8F9_9POAL|nr:transmembrane protein [Rhynchospora pubera]KAJ4766564.1 transmembrane protein [Rhynchospora pubera]KAJ4795451.1 transmembrane protein [Rhynchospora pubera]KAJ4819284.1 transmembrane protein [Rhynchospora pubera]
MPWCSPLLGSRIRSFFRDYDSLQGLAIVLIYIQIGCALIGSLGAFYNGVLLINLVVALFALVAIESGNQTLGRTYAVLLFLAIFLDIAWFILFSHTIWNIAPNEKYGALVVLSIKLALWMQIIGFSIRFLSSFVWVQMYRLGASSESNNPSYHDTDYDARNSFLNRAGGVARENSISDEILGGSIYDPAYYSSLFKDVRDNGCIREVDEQIRPDGESTSANVSPQIKRCTVRSFQSIDVDPTLTEPLNHLA